jgi:hypothetical protein
MEIRKKPRKQKRPNRKQGLLVALSIPVEAVAGGAVLSLVTHAMIPEAIEEAGSLIVLPTTAGFLAALYLALTEYSV